ncbi:hypothetical protein HKX48_002432 [Thoreauomyces humboldtii]|nr:hypothetical protein HKX48_002432 [Thoreauomyces humboldtii]
MPVIAPFVALQSRYVRTQCQKSSCGLSTNQVVVIVVGVLLVSVLTLAVQLAWKKKRQEDALEAAMNILADRQHNENRRPEVGVARIQPPLPAYSEHAPAPIPASSTRRPPLLTF